MKTSVLTNPIRTFCFLLSYLYIKYKVLFIIVLVMSTVKNNCVEKRSSYYVLNEVFIKILSYYYYNISFSETE